LLTRTTTEQENVAGAVPNSVGRLQEEDEQVDGPLKLLIVEDSEDDCELLLREVRQAGYAVEYERVETAAAMRWALDERRWDAVISDYSLPQFDGLEALRLLRQIDSEMPFILVSGTIGEHIAVSAMKAGADDYLIKGELARFVPALERALRDAEARRDRRLAQEKLKLAGMVFKGTSEGIVITNADCAIIEVNDAFSAMTGYRAAEVLGQNPRILSSGLHDERFFRAMWESIESTGRWEGEIWNARKSGEVFPGWLSITALKGERNEISHYVGIINDITPFKESQKKLEYLANYDGLTDLPNRSFFHARLQHAI
jgi:PAS domain S-box-containing protein